MNTSIDPRTLCIDTPRLWLRPPRAEDFDAWAAFLADPEAMRYLGGPQARAVAWRAMLGMAGAWLIQGYGMFSVIEKASGRWVGRLGPWQPEGWPGTEVGWGIVRDCWGKGYAVEGASAAIDWAFAELGWSEVVHVIDPDNQASQRVAQRLGSTLRGPTQLPEPYRAMRVELWGQQRDEWTLNRARLATASATG